MTPASGSPRLRAPLFSVVSAVYDVARYLPAYIASVEAQTFDLGSVEVIVVDDGSTDGSVELLAEWQRRSPGLVRLLEVPHGGQGNARNRGLAAARGVWVTFADPDDVLDRRYLERVARFLDSAAEPPSLVATYLLMLDDATGRTRDNHPLRGRFAAGDRVVDLEQNPDCFQLSSASAFFPRAALEAAGLRFDPRVRPNFEDGHLIVRHLLAQPRPTVGLVGSARYLYRRRADGSSTIQRATATPQRYTDLLRYGYLDALTIARRNRGGAPAWLQTAVVYDLGWILRGEERLNAPPNAADLGVADEFHDLMARITRMLDADIVAGFRVIPIEPHLLAALVHGYSDEPWHEPTVVADLLDRDQGLRRLRYLHAGERPVEEVLVDGRSVRPGHAKSRSVRYSGRTLLTERLLWVPAGNRVELSLDGEAMPLVPGRVAAKPAKTPALARLTSLVRGGEPVPDWERVIAAARSRARPVRRAEWAVRRQGLELRRKMSSRNDRYADAWLLMDRDVSARDNAEHLFRYLRTERPDINAWFTVREGTDDFTRLQDEGIGHVIAFGGREWREVALRARHLLSSHIDEYVVRPPDLIHLRPTPWRFTFLQHGITHNDLSTWLNAKPIDLMVCATEQERAFLADDGSPFLVTTREATLTGFPRHDRLQALAAAAGSERGHVLVMPTWRQALVTDRDASGTRGAQPGFGDSDWARAWLRLLASPELTSAASTRGLSVVFMPHPNLEAALDHLSIPAGVRLVTYGDTDVQEMLARAAVVVTDYSSVAFDAAIIERPVVYYQFDAADMFAGTNLARRGTFSYLDDGFGPVCRTHGEAVSAVLAAVEAAGPPPAPYRDRIASTFAFRDQGSCARVVAAIEASIRPVLTASSGVR